MSSLDPVEVKGEIDQMARLREDEEVAFSKAGVVASVNQEVSPDSTNLVNVPFVEVLGIPDRTGEVALGVAIRESPPPYTMRT